MAEVEHEKLASAPRSLCFRVYAPQEIEIAFRIEDDYDLTATNILGNEKLGEPTLPDSRRSEN